MAWWDTTKQTVADRHLFIIACEDCLTQQGWWKMIASLSAAYALGSNWLEHVDFGLTVPSITIPKVPLIPAAILCLLIALGLLLEGSYRLRVAESTEIEVKVTSEQWTAMGKEFHELYAHFRAFWKDGVWKLETDKNTERQARASFKKAGLMVNRNSSDPVSDWLDLVRARGYFEVEQFNGRQDIEHGGYIAQAPIKSAYVCKELSADVLVPTKKK